MEYEDSPVVCYLYNLHENDEMTTEEKIKEITEKYEILKQKEKWDTINNFFINPIYTRISYCCKTYSNFRHGTAENRYIRSEISHESAVKGNIYFYILLSIIGGDNNIDIVPYTANHLTASKKTSQYLIEYGKEHGLHYDYSGRNCGKYLIRIMHCLVSESNGHNIYKCIELPI